VAGNDETVGEDERDEEVEVAVEAVSGAVFEAFEGERDVFFWICARI
jgi:hypothetical protein